MDEADTIFSELNEKCQGGLHACVDQLATVCIHACACVHTYCTGGLFRVFCLVCMRAPDQIAEGPELYLMVMVMMDSLLLYCNCTVLQATSCQSIPLA
jgi:hypothetical protein